MEVHKVFVTMAMVVTHACEGDGINNNNNLSGNIREMKEHP